MSTSTQVGAHSQRHAYLIHGSAQLLQTRQRPVPGGRTSVN
jgi:hypothetical protein